ncbi:NEDD8-specific protease 2 [Sphaceloma murrayae]|uniref:NEDD8-specific protease 2 n=1 Tax=Sphaceloma murrayae TaxID=2082308 RepID=A0A2K1QPQ1_9PEZI|nr:NEDD8-specific protease 2 [Sphaceloma murrayae]
MPPNDVKRESLLARLSKPLQAQVAAFESKIRHAFSDWDESCKDLQAALQTEVPEIKVQDVISAEIKELLAPRLRQAQLASHHRFLEDCSWHLGEAGFINVFGKDAFQTVRILKSLRKLHRSEPDFGRALVALKVKRKERIESARHVSGTKKTEDWQTWEFEKVASTYEPQAEGLFEPKMEENENHTGAPDLQQPIDSHASSPEPSPRQHLEIRKRRRSRSVESSYKRPRLRSEVKADGVVRGPSTATPAAHVLTNGGSSPDSASIASVECGRHASLPPLDAWSDDDDAFDMGHGSEVDVSIPRADGDSGRSPRYHRLSWDKDKLQSTDDTAGGPILVTESPSWRDINHLEQRNAPMLRADAFDGRLNDETIYHTLTSLNTAASRFCIVHSNVVDTSSATHLKQRRVSRVLSPGQNEIILPLYWRMGQHWTYAHADLNRTTITIYDSINDRRRDVQAFKVVKGFLSNLGIANNKWRLCKAESAQQSNNTDCGVFVIVFALCSMHELVAPGSIDGSLCRQVLQVLYDPEYSGRAESFADSLFSGIDTMAASLSRDRASTLLETADLFVDLLDGIRSVQLNLSLQGSLRQVVLLAEECWSEDDEHRHALRAALERQESLIGPELAIRANINVSTNSLKEALDLAEQVRCRAQEIVEQYRQNTQEVEAEKRELEQQIEMLQEKRQALE